MRHSEAAASDARPQVTTGVGSERGVQDVVGYVEPHEQPGPVGIVTGAADEAAVSGRNDLGGIVEMSSKSVNFRALGGHRVGQDRLDQSSLHGKWL